MKRSHECGFCRELLLLLLQWFCPPPRPVRIQIIKESAMSSPVEGTPFKFHVECKDAGGNVIAPTAPITVTSDNGTATVNPDGSGGQVINEKAGPMSVVASMTDPTNGPLTDTDVETVLPPPPVAVASIKIVAD